ncbi:MAG TPA: hypothetical protein PLL09_15825 [Flavobacterium sp.]|uniref:hypothetical protein n=1 Tax=unclassified Flavobacterium TaxID=196869 RepID=UPI0025BB7630|nr:MULTISPECIES: hypothetical protein [unclassified Flavobacterium]HRE79285.1 hypothetical protein [Flavobacterium sp.]
MKNIYLLLSILILSLTLSCSDDDDRVRCVDLNIQSSDDPQPCEYYAAQLNCSCD